MSIVAPTQIEAAPNHERDLSAIARERGAQRLVTAFILIGLGFMLLPGTFLGVWNLISISQSRSVTSLSPAWIQAHGHAQIFGWIGTFIIGICVYSLQKMQRSAPFPLSVGWTCWSMWTAGVLLRWATNIYGWHWRLLLPVSAVLELVAFLLFNRSVRGHRNSDPSVKQGVWINLVAASSIGFFATLVGNLGLTLLVAWNDSGPALPHEFDPRLLFLSTWGFIVLAIWGFNAKWLPVFVGLEAPSERGLMASLVVNVAGVACALIGFLRLTALLLLCGTILIILSLHVFERAQRPPKVLNVHPSFPGFVRISYVWLATAAVLTVWAVGGDDAGGIWGASRHALTVGFISTMVFAIGQRVLPAFCGMKILFSPRLMLWSMLLLNAGCFLRVASEIPAYEGYWRMAWGILPLSAIIELTAVTLFAANIAITIFKPIKKLA